MVENIFEKGLEMHQIVNNAYPPKKELFRPYKEEIKGLGVIWDDVDEMSLYVHIPFCKSRCGFCDYAVVGGASEEDKEKYVGALIKEIEMHDLNKKIIGFDIGGGTPTVLSASQLERIVSAVESRCLIDDDIVKSIETTPSIAANEPEKMKALKQMGFGRISMGVNVLNGLRQEGNGVKQVVQAMENIRTAGFENVNVDIMYGFPGQESIAPLVEFVSSLCVESVTLYRFHKKHTSLEGKEIVLDKAVKHYDEAYEYLKRRDYCAEYGQNTFSKSGDMGLSSYLENRSLNAGCYLGLGMGAQSMFKNGLSYNSGKNGKDLEAYLSKVEKGEFPTEDLYVLPTCEMLAKSVAVSMYSGVIDMGTLSGRFGIDLGERFKEEIGFVLNNGLMSENDGILRVTQKGFSKMNGIIPLFYSKKAKEYLFQSERLVFK